MKNLLSILLLLVTGAILRAQTTETVQYTWMSGPNTLNAASAFGTKGVPSATNIPASIYGSMTWSDNTGNLWLFGGSQSNTNRFNALFRYNTALPRSDNDVSQYPSGATQYPVVLSPS